MKKKQCQYYDKCQWRTEKYLDDVFNDSVNIPKEMSLEEILKYILDISKDKRGHVLYKDHIRWQDIKFKGIAKLARKGIKLVKEG